MHDVSFRRIAPDESRIHVDGDDHVGDVYAMSDPSAAGGRVYIIHLDEDYRGPTRVHDRDEDTRNRRADDRHAPFMVVIPGTHVSNSARGDLGVPYGEFRVMVSESISPADAACLRGETLHITTRSARPPRRQADGRLRR